ncbi:protein EARLY FLOWERING 5-like isoform X1 [Phragmites australis]|uniref:protein EARLY FLOWERING 5-like isoform X1 n=1 Tax=Phragmites australis TaxID=29695 RepID=UPI002D7A01A6|nr:protein EARLY FLOWERING 5-like isoform X1 [Phragmites australis]
MEKNGLLGVRKKLPPGKRLRSKLVAPVPAGGGGALAKAIADYLASDSYMYAPLASAPPPPPPPPQPKAAPSAAVPSAPPEKEVTLVQNTEALGELPSPPARKHLWTSCWNCVLLA